MKRPLPIALAFLAGLATAALLGAAAPRADGPYAKLDVFAKVLSYIDNNYVEDVDDSKLVYSAVKGMVGTLDPHSAFLEPREYQSMKDDTTGEFGGVGLEVEKVDAQLVVRAAIDESPAARAGIRGGDVIIGVDSVSVKSLDVGDVAGMLKGAPGTQVTLQILRPEFAAPRDFVLVRDHIRLLPVSGKLLDGKIGYVRIKSFQERTDSGLEKELNKQRTAAGGALSGLVLDLRGNPGGLLQEGVAVADRFIRHGLILATRGRNGRHPEEETATERGTEPDYPMIVLVNGGTASASEVVAGALQDHKRAVILGSTTYGKGSVQTVIDLDDGSGLKLTVARYYTPSGRSIQERGIAPDVKMDTGEKANARIESKLPRHISNDAPGDPVVSVEVGQVLGAIGEVEDKPLAAAEQALRSWDRFQTALAVARAAKTESLRH